MSAKDIFDQALGMNMRDRFLVPVHNKAQQESLRVSLSYNRRLFYESTNVDFEILISKVTKGETHYVVMTKMPRITSGIILSPDGSAKTVNLAEPTQTVLPPAVTPDTDQRIRKAMEEDGCSQEEIEDYFSKTSNVDTLLGQEEITDE